MKRWAIPIILTILVNPAAKSWRLVTIQSVEDEGKTFTTHTLPREDSMAGREGTFTVDHFSIVAKTIHVDEYTTRWEVTDPRGSAPFDKDQVVTFNPSVEQVWLALSGPGGDTSKGPKEQEQEQYQTDESLEALFVEKHAIEDKPTLQRGLRLRLHQALGVGESISGVSGTLESKRWQWQGEYCYFWEVQQGIELELGLRMDREINEFNLFTTTSSRQYLTFGSNLSSHKLLPYDSLATYLGVAMGLGFSSTEINLHTQGGPSFIIPHVRVGVDWQLSGDWGLNLEGGVESIFSREKTKAGPQQKNSQINAKIAVGLRYNFNSKF